MPVEDNAAEEVVLSEEEQNELAEEEGFESGFAGGEEPAPEPEPAEVEEPEPAPEPAALDPSLTPATEPAAEEPAGFEKRMRNMEGKFGELNTTLKQALDHIAETKVKESGAEAPTKAAQEAAKNDTEKLEALREQFPEWADAIQESRDMVTGLIDQRVPDAVSMGKDIQEATMLAVKQLLADQEIDNSHEDWKNTLNTEAFGRWWAVQGPDVLALDTVRAKDTIKVLNLFAEHMAPVEDPAVATKTAATAKQQGRLERALSPTDGTRQAPPKQRQTEEDDFTGAFATTRGRP